MGCCSRIIDRRRFCYAVFLSDTDVKKTATITEITDQETTSKEIPLPDKQSIITEKEPSHNPETALQVNETKPLLPAAEKKRHPSIKSNHHYRIERCFRNT